MNLQQQPEARDGVRLPGERPLLAPRVRRILEDISNPATAPAPDSPEAKARIDRLRQAEQRLNETLLDPTRSPLEHRQAIEQVYGGHGAGELDPSHYGELVVSRISALYAAPNIQNLRREKTGITWNENEQEAETLVDAIFDPVMGGMHMPQIARGMGDDAIREQIISNHRYCTIEGGNLRIRARFVRQDLDRINAYKATVGITSPNDQRKMRFLENLSATLDEIRSVDVASYNQEGRYTRPGENMDPRMQRACNHAQILIALVLGFLAVMCAIVERKKKFQVMTMIYGGLALAVMSPSIFKGRMEEVRRSLGFVHTTQWDLFISRYRTQVTGPNGERLMRALMQDEVQDAGRTLDRNNSEPYFRRLAQLGVPREHIEFLQQMERDDRQNRTSYFSMLVGHTSAIRGEEEQLMLINFARHGMNARSLAALHEPDRPETPPPAGVRNT